MKRVLVVDDEQSVRTLVSLSLEGPDCKVETFCDGRDALEALNDDRFDLILLDVGLPGMRGDEVLRRLRSDKRTASIPVVMLTGLEPPEGSQPDGIVMKPFTPASLRGSIQNWLS